VFAINCIAPTWRTVLRTLCDASCASLLVWREWLGQRLPFLPGILSCGFRRQDIPLGGMPQLRLRPLLHPQVREQLKNLACMDYFVAMPFMENDVVERGEAKVLMLGTCWLAFHCNLAQTSHGRNKLNHRHTGKWLRKCIQRTVSWCKLCYCGWVVSMPCSLAIVRHDKARLAVLQSTRLCTNQLIYKMVPLLPVHLSAMTKTITVTYECCRAQGLPCQCFNRIGGYFLHGGHPNQCC
jgi:hypothetical protein